MGRIGQLPPIGIDRPEEQLRTSNIGNPFQNALSGIDDEQMKMIVQALQQGVLNKPGNT